MRTGRGVRHDDKVGAVERRVVGLVVAIALWSRGAVAAPAPCADAAATVRDIAPSDGPRDDDVVGMGLPLVRARISPACRKALDAGQWPELAELLRPVLAAAPGYRAEACLLAPPELLPDITAWVKAGNPHSAREYIECTALLLRTHRIKFDELVTPQPSETLEFAARIPAEDRSFLLPRLEAATRNREPGRDELFRVACAGEPARSAPACRAPASLEASWVEEESPARQLRNDMAPHVILAGLYAVFVLAVGWRGKRREFLTVAASLGGAATAAALAWAILASPTAGAGAVNVLNTVFGLVGAPIAAVVGGVIGWVAMRAKLPARPWCLAQAVLYPLFVYLYFTSFG